MWRQKGEDCPCKARLLRRGGGGGNVRHETCARLREVAAQLVPLRVVVFVQLPVPPKPCAKRVLSLPRPVLQPVRSWAHASFDHALMKCNHRSCPSLIPNDGSRRDPVGERRKTTRVRRVLFNETESRASVDGADGGGCQARACCRVRGNLGRGGGGGGGEGDCWCLL
jgi:hypothetical protein